MCTVLAGLQIATTITQGILGYAGASDQAEATEDAYKANLENTKTATYERYDAINRRVMQDKAAADQQLQEAQIEGVRARGSARVASREGGVSGHSVDNVLRDMYSTEARFGRNTAVNFDYSRDALISEARNTRASAQSNINAQPRGQKPSLFGTVLNIFGSSLETVSNNMPSP